MAEMTTLTTDPFFALAQMIGDNKAAAERGVLEMYKMAADTSNAQNSLQTSLHLYNATQAADTQNRISSQHADIIENQRSIAMFAQAERASAAVEAARQTTDLLRISLEQAALTNRLVSEEGSRTRDLIQSLNTQNLNTALINTNTALTGLGVQFGGLGLAYGGAVAAYQQANTNSALNALNSAISSQGVNVVGSKGVDLNQSSSPTTM